MKKFFNSFIFKLLVFLIGLVIGAGIIFGLFLLFPTKTSKITNINKLEKEVTVTDAGIADAVEKVYDAVVIVTTSKGNVPVSTGSGFVYKVDGDDAYIITNNHVISGGDSYTLTYTNDKVSKCTLVGADKFSDIAILKTNKENIISVAPIGKTSDLRIGDTVFAVGTPVNSEVYTFSVTRGILSGKDRVVEVSLDNSLQANWVMKVLQTDTAINSGNSGGPLVNYNGEVVGVTNMKLASTGVEGMGFAITIENALSTADKIINNEEFVYPYMGLAMYNAQQVYYGYVKGEETNETTGVYVESVEKGSAGDKAGFKERDIIVSIDGEKVKNVATFRYYLYQHQIGEKVNIKVLRDGNEVSLSVKLVSK